MLAVADESQNLRDRGIIGRKVLFNTRGGRDSKSSGAPSANASS